MLSFLTIVIVVMLIAFLLFVIVARQQMYKIMFGLPWLTWLTIDRCIELGFSSYWCQVLVLTLYKKNQNIEIRPIVSIASELQAEWEKTLEFGPKTIRYYEFRLIGRKPRKFGGYNLSLGNALRPSFA